MAGSFGFVCADFPLSENHAVYGDKLSLRDLLAAREDYFNVCFGVRCFLHLCFVGRVDQIFFAHGNAAFVGVNLD